MLYQSVFQEMVGHRRRHAITVTEMKAALREIYKPFLTPELMRDICKWTRLEEESAALPRIVEGGKR